MLLRGNVRGVFRGILAERRFSVLKEPSNRSILEGCGNLHSRIQPLNDRLRGPLDKHSEKTTKMPFVFLLGNHSSGKSSFVNYVLQRKIQEAGVAPTDDSFTVIVPGPTDMDRDGPAFVGDPDLGFGGLRHFGPGLIHHTQLKVRANIAVNDIMLVDSPGMIDSPASRDRTNYNASMERGYDFEGVVKWYAERADVILLFFDPDKPGTTGETLSTLTNSLTGLDHKLHIILNKADQFRKIHDFARAYGALCWNLSKVIHRKDLPRIFTMCLPQSYQSHVGDKPTSENSLGQGLMDLERTREEVVGEVMKAPKRRIDNAITRLGDSAALLQMHAKIVSHLRQQYRKQVWRDRILATSTAIAATGAAAATFYLGAPMHVVVGTSMVGLLGTVGMFVYGNSAAARAAEGLVSNDGVSAAFTRLYSRQVAERDEFTQSLWQRVRDNIKVSLTSSDLAAMDAVKKSELDMLEGILETELPRLRRLAAIPQFEDETTAQQPTSQASQ